MRTIASIVTFCTLLSLVLAEGDNEEIEHKHEAFLAVGIVILLSVCFVVFSVMQMKVISRFVPETVVTIGFGVLVTIVMHAIDYSNGLTEDSPGALTSIIKHSNLEVFSVVILPFCLLDSGFAVHKRTFFNNIGSILSFAVIGTLLSAIVYAMGLWGLSQAGLVPELSFNDCFAYGSLISAVDPVATLSTLASMNAPRTLFSLIFGESILNDAIAMVLFNSVRSFKGHEFSIRMIFEFLWTFVLTSVVSTLVGVVVGLVTALLTAKSKLHTTSTLESLIIISSVFLSYLIAQCMGFSGIMAILFCGIVEDQFALQNLSKNSQKFVFSLMHLVAFVSETAIFFFLGVFVPIYMPKFRTDIFCWTMVLITLGRAINVFGLAKLLNPRRSHKISRGDQLVMWWGGLRGAIAFVLSLGMASDSEMWTAVTLGVVVCTVSVMGSTTEPLVKKLGICGGADKDEKPFDIKNATKMEKLTYSLRSLLLREGLSLNSIMAADDAAPLKTKGIKGEIDAESAEHHTWYEPVERRVAVEADLGDIEHHALAEMLEDVDVVW